jgi:hypothetical protein
MNIEDVENTYYVRLSDSDIEMLLNSMSFELENNTDLTPDYEEDLADLFMHLDSVGEEDGEED